MSVCNVYDGNKWIPIEESTYCPVYTSQDWPINWYKWLSFVSNYELEVINNSVEKEKINILRLRIANLILKQKEKKIFTYQEQQEVFNFTKENNLDDIINEKLSYFPENEREKIRKKVLKEDE